MTRTSSPRNDFLDLVKGALIFLVVYGHSIQFAGYGKESGDAFLADPVFKALYLFHMALFIAISGYFTRGAVLKRSFIEFNRLRFTQIVIPMLAWSVTYHTATIAATVLKTRDLHAGITQLAEFPVLRLGMEFWFLWAVFIGGFVVSAAHRLGKLMVPAYLLAYMLLLLLPGNELVRMIQFTFPFFIVGYWVADARVPKKFPPVFYVTAFALAVLVWHYWNHDTYAYTSGMKWRGNEFNLLLRYLGGVVGSLVMLEIIWRLSRVWKPAFATRWGRETLAIYVVQTYLFIPIAKIPHPFRDWIYFNISFAPLLAAAICCFCEIVAAVIRKNRWSAFFYLGVPLPKIDRTD